MASLLYFLVLNKIFINIKGSVHLKEMSRIKTVSLVGFLVVVWGISWPIYKIALDYTPPILFAGMRTLFGGLLLAILFFSKRDRIRWKENWRIYSISALFNVVLFFGLQTYGLMFLPSGLFSVLVYLQPVLVGLLAWIWLGESMSVLKIIGLTIGFIGVITVSSGGFSGHIAIVGIILALLTGICWSFGTIYVKKVANRVDSMWLTTFQFIIGGIFLSGLGIGTENYRDIIWNSSYISGLLFGAILGVAASWITYITLVNNGDASKVASFTFMVPLISVFTSSIFLKEAFTTNLLFGLIFIVCSIYLVNRKPKVKKEPAEHDALRIKKA
jgi:drug/metabolite transporter (DMT)-like permease